MIPQRKFEEFALEKAVSAASKAIHAIVNARLLMLESWTRSLTEQLEQERLSIARATTVEGDFGIRTFDKKSRFSLYMKVYFVFGFK